MFFSAQTLVSSFITVTVLTSPVAAVYVKYCENANYGGKCIEISPAVGECVSIPSNMNDKLSSYKVERGSCDFFKHGGCQERLWTAENRSHDQVTTAGHNDAVVHPLHQVLLPLEGYRHLHGRVQSHLQASWLAAWY
ncbi:hypothetical protein B0T16DRAFT_391044 [Cercophora newfieldiana]|uniref:Uncharacterized protein n=1 Tax=Cercophora newfieldiana TaxID=92897 RepID=A0AA39Y766_9PEZI|nr:hypothetical protein B0T16DRAFT_391044 [Cercophora newfieldiana]